MVEHARTAAFSGFTPAGTAKDIPKVIAALAEVASRDGLPFKIGVLTGVSTGASLDGALRNADAISFRTPYHFGLPADPVRNVELPRECAAYVVSLRKNWTQRCFYHRGDRDDWLLSEQCLCRSCDRANKSQEYVGARWRRCANTSFRESSLSSSQRISAGRLRMPTIRFRIPPVFLRIMLSVVAALARRCSAAR